jgi:hypothetical protein
MRNFLFVLLGALLLFVILKMISGAGKNATPSTEKLRKLAFLPQTENLVKTNEFKELVKTKEFQEFVKTLAEEQAVLLAQSLLNVQQSKG